MNCKNCGAPLTLLEHNDHFKCEHCGTNFFPEVSPEGITVFDRQTTSICPVCEVPLVEARVDDFKILHCENCKGNLIDTASFVKIIELLRAQSIKPHVPNPPMNPEDLKRQTFCPYCKKKMDTHPYGGPGNIVIDNCPRCKVNWLDYKELEKIIRAPDRSHKRFSRKYELELLLISSKNNDFI